MKIMLMRFIGFDNLKWKNEKGVKVSKKMHYVYKQTLLTDANTTVVSNYVLLI